jgi:RHS repeat-associated protein
VKKIVRKQGGDSVVSVYIDGGFEHLYKRSSGGTKSEEHNELQVMDGRTRIASVRVGTAFGLDTSPTVRYTLEDHLGNASFTLDSSGSLTHREEYFPFGETSFGSYTKKRYRFCGKERDEESGLYYYGARYYMPWQCRFVSVDPLAGEYPFYTPYQYAGNQPVIAIDLDGLEPASAGGTEAQAGTQSSSSQMSIPAPLMSLESLANPGGNAPASDIQPHATTPERAAVVLRDRDLKNAAAQFTVRGDPNSKKYEQAEQLYQKEGEPLPYDSPDPPQLATDQGGAMANLEKELEIQIQAGGDPNTIGKLQFEIRQYEYISAGKDPATLQPFQTWQETALNTGMSLLMIRRGMGGGIKGSTNGNSGMVRVRHHTGPKGGKGINANQAINPSRSKPHGVDVELPPFVKPQKANFGQAERGAYVEFSIPRDRLSRIPGSMDDPAKVARIETGGPKIKLDISNLQPKVKIWRNWWNY